MNTLDERDFDLELLFENEKAPARPRPGPARVAPAPARRRGARPPAATPLLLVPFVTLDKFAFRGTVTPAAHKNAILRVAHLLAASAGIGAPIRGIELIGHADHTGGDAVNQDVGLKRARDVADKITREMERIRRGSAAAVNMRLSSRGEAQPRVAANSGCVELNRRVEIRLPANCQTFFAEYDLQSFPGDPVLGLQAHPNIPDKKRRQDTVMAVVDQLRPRLDDRARQALKGDIKKESPLDPRDLASRINAAILSELQLELIRKYHPGSLHGFSPASLMRCFQNFANGELRSPHADFPNQGVNEPDSSFFFLFAEFGFLCVDSGIDADAWAHALRAMVCAQEVFMHVYRKNPVPAPPVTARLPSPGAATHPLGDYSRANFKPVGASTTRGIGQSDAARKQRLIDKYAKLGLGELRARAAENLLRAQRF